MALGGPFYELLAHGGRVECGVERVGELHPVEYRPRVENLIKNHADMAEAGDRPDLGVVVAESTTGSVSAKTGKASIRGAHAEKRLAHARCV